MSREDIESLRRNRAHAIEKLHLIESELGRTPKAQRQKRADLVALKATATAEVALYGDALKAAHIVAHDEELVRKLERAKDAYRHLAMSPVGNPDALDALRRALWGIE